MRTNHFHTGLDIKTAGVEGQTIHATADGYVSRINKSPWGYGNVIYVKHPNGYTTVYGHLQKFNKEIEAFYAKVQEKKQLFHLDLYPGPNAIPVSKGDIIALSGNSGSSGGPHLHFEIRETVTENPINPMLFGFKIKDNLPPRIQGIRIYQFPTDSAAGICNRNHSVSGSNGKYQLSKGTSIPLNGYGKYGLAVHTTDMLNGSGNICGVFNIKLFLDDNLIYEHQLDTLDFYTNRYMNAHTDYNLYKETKKSYHKSFTEPNDKLDIYKNVNNRGVFDIKDNKPHNVTYIITDVSGNQSTIKFSIINNMTSNMPDVRKSDKTIMCCSNSQFLEDGVAFRFPPGVVYNHTPYNYSKNERLPGRLSPTHTINTTKIPIQQKYFIKIKCDIPEGKEDKAIIVEEDNKRLYARGGHYSEGWVTTRVRSFGSYYVMLDDVKPVIVFKNVKNNVRFTGRYIFIRAVDNLSGIKNYNAFIGDNWAPAEYVSKKAHYKIDLNRLKLTPGKYTLRFEATDERGNRAEKSITLLR